MAGLSAPPEIARAAHEEDAAAMPMASPKKEFPF